MFNSIENPLLKLLYRFQTLRDQYSTLVRSISADLETLANNVDMFDATETGQVLLYFFVAKIHFLYVNR